MIVRVELRMRIEILRRRGLFCQLWKILSMPKLPSTLGAIMLSAYWTLLVSIAGLQIFINVGVSGYHCPGAHLDLEEFQGVTPYGNASEGMKYENAGSLPLEECVYACCESTECNIVFRFRGVCYLIKCESSELCEPLARKGVKFENAFIIKVRPVEMLEDEHYNGHFFDIPEDQSEQIYIMKNGVRRRGEKSETNPASDICMLSADCGPNESCTKKNNRSRQGVCKCKESFSRDKVTGQCLKIPVTTITPVTMSSTVEHPMVTPYFSVRGDKNSATDMLALNVTSTTSSSTMTSLRHLVVSAGDNKVVQLPENSISLSAFAVPKEAEGEQYKYEWTLITHPAADETGTMTDSNSPTMKLSGLKEGLYTFKITVSSESATGESYVNVTVLPPKRVNQAPVAAINPVNQTVKLPNTDTVLDGSASTDDDKIVSYVWGIVTAPMEYTPQFTETATLQLKNLIPGFYRFMLTVTDSDGVKNSTYANVTVIKETDYPPVANAGGDVVIYLPQKEVNLSGSLSTDDKGIKSWEWTKGDGVNKAVDMQNTRTPLLHLSNLEVGMYTFILRVTDTSDQFSTAEVHVFVKPGNEGPVADAGPNQEITLPMNTVTLNGTKSYDDIGISQWEWKQVNGPSLAKIENADQPQAVATGLTKGVYVFQLTVYDDKKATNSKTVTITVKQSKNEPPRANAGGDRSIQLPCNLVVLNGSASTDDVGIVSYEWIRDSSSLAAGEILQGSETTPLLMLTGFVPGRYLFRLTVTDAERSTSSDTASLIVKPALNEKDDVQMSIAADIYSFTEEQKVTIAKKLGLLLQEETESVVVISKVSMEKNTNGVILVFHVEKNFPGGQIKIHHGPDVVRTLKKKLKMDSALLNLPVISIDTVICQNNCSGHGSCDQFTKQCVCEAFWMENLFKYYFAEESNCDWSILYVVIVLFVILVFMGTVSWAFFCLCSWRQKRPRLSSRIKLSRPRKKQRYSLLENYSDRETKLMLPKDNHQNNSVMVSDSDLESDTLFEQNGKINKLSNGFSKLPDESGNSPQKVRT